MSRAAFSKDSRSIMSARIFVLCLLSSVISTGASLKCQTCISNRGECRNEEMKMVECKANEGHCLTLSFRSTMNTPMLSLTFKGCARTDQCAKGYYSATSLADKYEQKRIACCESDGCNWGPLPILRHNELKPNGLTCPGAYEENGSSMENGTVLCLGNEVQCYNAKFQMRALAAFPVTINVKGCANQNVCTYPKGETEQGNGLLRLNLEKMECQNPQGMEGWNGFSKTMAWGWN